jgi:predicted aspartyl protease
MLKTLILAATAAIGATTAAAAGETQVIAEYSGEYRCVQGPTALRLQVFGDLSQPTHTVVFQFGPTIGNPTVPTGSFALEGTLQTNGGRLDLHPTQWISQPYGYTMVGLNGLSTDGGNTFLGSVVNGLGCSSFAIHRTILAATAVAPIATTTRTVTSGSRAANIALTGNRTEHHIAVGLNGVGPFDFLLDTGASSCLLPQTVMNYLINKGAVVPTRDFVGMATATIADGSQVQEPLYRLSISVGAAAMGAHVTGVACGVIPNGSALLGMGFLGAFDSFAIDNTHNTLSLKWTERS